jgi:DNA repair protein RadC
MWIATGNNEAIPPSYLFDIVLAQAGAQFISNTGLGSKLIEEFGSIGGVIYADIGRLLHWMDEEGLPRWLGKQICLRLKATATLIKLALAEDIKARQYIRSTEGLFDYLRIAMGSEPIEHFRIIFLDKKNYLIKDEVQQRGTVDHTPLYPREVAKRSLELGASAVILVHNHPSGDPTPSRTDIEMTKQVEAALTPLSISLHDHLIICVNKYISFRQDDLI